MFESPSRGDQTHLGSPHDHPVSANLCVLHSSSLRPSGSFFLFLLGPSWIQVFHLLFLDKPQITLASCPVLNPATLPLVPFSSDAPPLTPAQGCGGLMLTQLGLLEQTFTDPSC